MNLKTLRRKRLLTQVELAKLVGVDHTFISHIESGRRLPSYAVAKRIAQALRCAIDDLDLELGDGSKDKN